MHPMRKPRATPPSPLKAAGALIGLAIVMLLLVSIVLGPVMQWAETAVPAVTGETNPFSQMRALGQLAMNGLRPPLDLEPGADIPYARVNPYGINTFLHLEADPAARERSLSMIHEAGIHWIRQQFAWYDLEVGGKGIYTDTRQTPPISAWAKYDDIVSLAGRYEVEIIARLDAPPNWTRADGGVRGAFAPPDNIADYGDFVYAVVSRYKGSVHYWQLWNEPNLAYEWGKQPDPEAYAQLLCTGYRRVKEADPNAVVLAAALAPTVELGAPWIDEGTNLTDLIVLQRLYDAGAGGCFDILSAQGYGLFSGPGDHRTGPLQINFSRNVLLRDIMVRNGDAHKAIWISEMNWNAVPDAVPDRRFGQVSLQQQADDVVQAYQRAQREWPWVGVVNFWFFKRPDTSEQDQSWYYFRMVEPDFTPLPVYDAVKALTAGGR